jgi:hypothetical protein
MADEVVGSKLEEFPGPFTNAGDNTKTGYGQNGYRGASSDMDPIKNPTRSAMAVALFGDGTTADPDPKDAKQPKFAAPQTRQVSNQSYPLSYGMDQRTSRKA